MNAYCVKCKTKREMNDPKEITMRNGRPAAQGVCPICGTKMFRIGKKREFTDVKGNCGHRSHISVGIDHCKSQGDDCEEPGCPHIEPRDYPRTYDEAQCPTCGSIVSPDEIEDKSYWEARLSAFAAGLATAILIVAIIHYYF